MLFEKLIKNRLTSLFMLEFSKITAKKHCISLAKTRIQFIEIIQISMNIRKN